MTAKLVAQIAWEVLRAATWAASRDSSRINATRDAAKSASAACHSLGWLVSGKECDVESNMDGKISVER